MSVSLIHLRTQSSYSFLESALRVEQIIELAKQENMPAICLSDRGNLFGSLEFAIGCKNLGLQPIHGIVLNLKIPGLNKSGGFAEILLIAKDEEGYKNLIKLNSYTFTKNDRKVCEHITFNDLVKHHKGIIVLSSYTEGVIGKFLLLKNIDQAVYWIKIFKRLLGDRFYIELMRHKLENEQLIEQDYINLAIDNDVPLVATNSILFKDIKMHDVHDVLLCISQGVNKEVIERRRVSNQCFFKSQLEMSEVFKDLPEAIENTVLIAQRCSFMLKQQPPMLPKFTDGISSENDLIKIQAEDGLSKRLNNKFAIENIPEAYQKDIKGQYFLRLNYELEVVCGMNFAGYFLIVSDLVKWSKSNKITVGPGRGSGAGSLIAWSLLITNIDPIKFGLLFERFLNPERISMPDFDIDFCQERREEVIQYVCNKYGYNKVGQIITFGKMQAKAVIKDVSRVLALPYNYANYLTELVPFNAVNPTTLKQAINDVPELKSAAIGRGLYNMKGEELLIQRVLSTALALEGLHRHASIHAAGIVISSEELIEVVPIYQDIHSKMLVVQYSMKYVELAGLIKFDFLGLQTLTLITKCRDLLQNQKIKIDFNNISFNDKKTYEMLSKGESTGVFQFESIGMKDTLRRLKPDCIDDIIALGSLYRPGPMENIPAYIARKHTKQKPNYLHPLIEPILKETYGVIIYQEQVLEIAKILAGYSLGNADLLRRAMGKKIKSEMDAQREIFISGAKSRGVDIEQAKSIFNTVAKFAGYGFNKAHASAYGAISYQTAYLKANFPVEFIVSCLNMDINNNNKMNSFIQEARDHQIYVISPDINESNSYFTIKILNEKKSIVYALGAIKNVALSVSKVIENERDQHGIFKNITDFIERIPCRFLNRRVLESLIKAGCFDKIHSNRVQLLLITDKLINYSSSYHQEKSSSQLSLLKISSSYNIFTSNLNTKQNEVDILSFYELEVLGLFINKHPLAKYEDLLNKMEIFNSNLVKNKLPQGFCSIKIAGFIQKKDIRMSSKGRFVILYLSDQYGIFELTIFSEEVLKNYTHILKVGSLIIATCDTVKDEGGIKLIAKDFTNLEDLDKQKQINITLHIGEFNKLKEIVELLKNNHVNTHNDQVRVLITLFFSIDNIFFVKTEFSSFFYINKNNLELLKNFSND